MQRLVEEPRAGCRRVQGRPRTASSAGLRSGGQAASYKLTAGGKPVAIAAPVYASTAGGSTVTLRPLKAVSLSKATRLTITVHDVSGRPLSGPTVFGISKKGQVVAVQGVGAPSGFRALRAESVRRWFGL